MPPLACGPADGRVIADRARSRASEPILLAGPGRRSPAGRWDPSTRPGCSAMAAALSGGMLAVHEDERSILMLDRDPIEWEGEGQHGLAWVEGDVWRGPAASWEQASRLGACGLVLSGRRRLVHSSVSGLGRVYWIEEGRATYFATRIDPLVASAPRPLSVDWDAWAAIIALRYPVGTRTPFAEVSRLAPHAAIGRRLGRTRVERPRGRGPRSSPTSASTMGPMPGSRRCARRWRRSARRCCARSAAGATRASSSAGSRGRRRHRAHGRRRRGRAVRGGSRRAGGQRARRSP